jgi:hypothetical protein
MDFARVTEELGKLLSFSADRKEIGEESRTVCIARAVDPSRLERWCGWTKGARRCFADSPPGRPITWLVSAVAWTVRDGSRTRALTARRDPRALPDRPGDEEQALPEQQFEIRLLKLLWDGPG